MEYCRCEFWRNLGLAALVALAGVVFLYEAHPPKCRQERVIETYWRRLPEVQKI